MKMLKYAIITVVCCIILQICAYLIPTEWVYDHIIESEYDVRNGGLYTLSDRYYSLRIDTFTDSWMLNIAAYSGKQTVLQKAFGQYYYDWSTIPLEENLQSGPFVALTELAKGNKDMPTASYARYWHGYIFFLKIMLLAFTYTDIRMINSIILFGLSCYLLISCNKYDKKVARVCAVMIISICPISAFFCMTYTGVMYIMLISSIMIVNMNKKSRSSEYIYYLISGILTSWIDLLTFPLITLGIPLIFSILTTEQLSVKKDIFKVFIMSACWLLGYAGMWCLKWLLSSLVLNQNIIADSLSVAKVRSGDTVIWSGEKITYNDVICASVGIYNKPAYYVVGISFVVYCIYIKIKNRLVFDKDKVIPLILATLLPLVWCFVIKNHTYEHSIYTYRIWAIAWTALAGILTGCCVKKTPKNIK